jgi:hypothetical protein
MVPSKSSSFCAEIGMADIIINNAAYSFLLIDSPVLF